MSYMRVEAVYATTTLDRATLADDDCNGQIVFIQTQPETEEMSISGSPQATWIMYRAISIRVATPIRIPGIPARTSEALSLLNPTRKPRPSSPSEANTLGDRLRTPIHPRQRLRDHW